MLFKALTELIINQIKTDTVRRGPLRLQTLVLSFFLFAFFGVGCSQKITSKDILKEEIISLSDEYLRLHQQASGGITRISYHDSLEFVYAYGYNGQDRVEALHGDELFIAASITKTFLAVCILQQMEEKLLALDDKVANYIDKDILKKLTLYKGRSYENELTIAHLLRHQSGIVDYLNKGVVHLNGLNTTPNRNYTLKERLDYAIRIGENSAVNTPGKYHYSNTNYILLGIIAEQLEQKAISQIFEERIIRPLGLANTSLHPENNSLEKMFRGYFEDRELTRFTMEFNKENPAGGILTNVDDLVIFGRAVFNGKLFKYDETLKKMLDFEGGYGLGVMQFEKSRKTGRVIGHSGFDPGYTSYLIYLEDVDACIVTVINQSELRVEMPAFLVVKIVAAFKKYL